MATKSITCGSFNLCAPLIRPGVPPVVAYGNAPVPTGLSSTMALSSSSATAAVYDDFAPPGQLTQVLVSQQPAPPVPCAGYPSRVQVTGTFYPGPIHLLGNNFDFNCVLVRYDPVTQIAVYAIDPTIAVFCPTFVLEIPLGPETVD